MRYKFCIQDPSNITTTYLFEAIVEQLAKREVKAWHAMYAFVTGKAIELLCKDPVVESFIKEKEVLLLVGLDDVTDKYALTLLKELEDKHPNFKVKVLINKSSSLFHPKLSHFIKVSGNHTMIVGSGNLTPGGLKNNIEAYSIFSYNTSDAVDISCWDKFITGHAAELISINEKAFELAEKNRPKFKKRRKVEEEEEETVEEPAVEDIESIDEPDNEKIHMLVAQVPAAGGRWHQVHFNEVITKQYFKIKPNSVQRVFLHEVKSNGSLGPEEVRPCVMSKRNLNRKIEIAAKRDQDYPSNRSTPPIVIFREVGLRIHRYILLMLGDQGYNEMLEFTKDNESVGKGLRRVISPRSQIVKAWPGCYL